MSVVIRAVRHSDQADWQRLWTAYLEFYEATVSDAVYTSTFERLLGSDPRDFNGLIAELDGKPVGLAHYVFHRHGWKIEDVCYLQDLYVHPDMRGRQIGRHLIEAVYAAADAAGAPAVYWLTQSFNHQARKLYDKVGRETPFMKYTRPE